MKHIETILVLCALFITPILSQDEVNAEEIGNHFEGDMILNPEQLMAVKEESRNVLIASKYKWPHNTVHYRIDIEKFDPSQIEYIRKAMDTIESVSCIKFVEAGQMAKKYVNIVFEKPGCYAILGYQAKPQRLNLTPARVGFKCFRIGTIMHELLHALGFVHQQSAADRDKYVKILWKNIEPERKHNFKKYKYSEVSDFNVKYDYGSVMHYPEKSFSKNGEPTILPKEPNVTIGQRDRLSEGDILKLNRLYKCKKKNSG
ncbi:seminal metalloprotease 1 [Aedes albopictus]|uniref:Metalloendopeptidase n=1 Tax=Aedes albopictus TaxID=7160 RepID=A0ABM1Y1R2_AEDAL|nr:seminal metalloprotease 1 [Aedes albopictus]